MKTSVLLKGFFHKTAFSPRGRSKFRDSHVRISFDRNRFDFIQVALEINSLILTLIIYIYLKYTHLDQIINPCLHQSRQFQYTPDLLTENEPEYKDNLNFTRTFASKIDSLVSNWSSHHPARCSGTLDSKLPRYVCLIWIT